MAVALHEEIFNNGEIAIKINFSGIKDGVADENIKFTLYAYDKKGIPKFTETLQLDNIRKLYNQLNAISVIREGNKKSAKIIETSDKISFLLKQLEEGHLETILTLLKKFKGSEKITGLLGSLEDLEIENLQGAYYNKMMKQEIGNLQKLINIETTSKSDITKEIDKHSELKKYAAKQPEKIFQNWIENNLWVFGIEYIRHYDFRKISMSSEGDLLMETVDGYLDLIELKKPSHELLKHDPSHNCHYPHSDLAKVLGQSIFYLQKLSEFKLNIERDHNVKVIMPRIKIVIGRNYNHDDSQKDCIRMLNANLNSMQVITYDDLVSFGNLLLMANEKKLPAATLLR